MAKGKSCYYQKIINQPDENSLSDMEREFFDTKCDKKLSLRIFSIVLRLSSELADDVRRRFLRRKPQKLSPPAEGGRALSSAKKAVAFFALESCAAHI